MAKENTCKKAALACKLNIYGVHRLLEQNKSLGQSDMNIWKEVRNLFESTDFDLQMELRDIKTIWGETREVDELLKGDSGKT